MGRGTGSPRHSEGIGQSRYPVIALFVSTGAEPSGAPRGDRSDKGIPPVLGLFVYQPVPGTGRAGNCVCEGREFEVAPWLPPNLSRRGGARPPAPGAGDAQRSAGRGGNGPEE